MQPTERFLALVSGPSAEVPLDEGSLCIAGVVDRTVDVAQWLAALDALAASFPDPSFDGVRRHLFEVLGFAGDTQTYEAPENSLLHRVLVRRRGIPITLSVGMIAVATRLGVGIEPIGMPGHFLVRDPGTGTFCDPFGGGVLLDVEGCRAIHDELFGSRRTFSPDLLAPVPTRAVLARILANLERGPLGNDLTALAPLLRLHLAIPGLPPGDRLSLVPYLRRVGAYAQALEVVESVQRVLDGQHAGPVAREAAALRARLN